MMIDVGLFCLFSFIGNENGSRTAVSPQETDDGYGSDDLVGTGKLMSEDGENDCMSHLF